MSKSFTSVKVDKDVYEQFKQSCVHRKFHLQDLVNRSLYLFMNDAEFRETVYNYNVPILSKESQETVLPSLQQSQQ